MGLNSRVLGAVVMVWVGGVGVVFGEKPVPVSPGRPDAVSQSAQRCPTFSWALAPQATAYRLVVYRVPEDRQAEPDAVIEQDLPGGTTSWTVGLGQCLVPGQTYAWRVAAVPVEGEAAWSEPSWFGVSGESALVSDRLVDLVAERLLLRRQGEERVETVGVVRPAGAVPAPTIRVRAAAPAVAFSVGSTGNVVGGAFYGDGSNLMNLNANALGSGTVPSGVLSGTYSNALVFSNAANSFAGSGSGLTGLNPAGITGLTSGGVVFGTSGGTVGQDAAELFWNQTSHRLGIGTNAPSDQLTLTGMLALPTTAASSGSPSAGVVKLGGVPFLHGYGSYNIFIGRQAGNFTTTGTANVAIGYASLDANTTGTNNTAIGPDTLTDNLTGGYNTAVGHEALYNNLDGSYNIAVGNFAGRIHTTGDHNIYIDSQGVADENDTMRIGGSQTRTFIAGISGVDLGGTGTQVYINGSGQLGTVPSSIRFKQDVVAMGDASSRLMDLRPVTFRYKSHPDGPTQYGLIAEEVNEVMPELVVRDASGEPETVAYHQLPAMLLNELKKQRATIQAQQAQIEELRRLVQVLVGRRAGTDARGGAGR